MMKTLTTKANALLWLYKNVSDDHNLKQVQLMSVQLIEKAIEHKYKHFVFIPITLSKAILTCFPILIVLYSLLETIIGCQGKICFTKDYCVCNG